jgi:hypothetical protein
VATSAYKKYSRDEQRALAVWAAGCAERVLPMFEEVCPKDDRPREAIAACRAWVRTGVFKMAAIRAASLGAHAAARSVFVYDTACFAARAAGQAVATAHVTQHAYGAAIYALKAIVAANSDDAEAKVAKERNWQSRRLPKKMRDEIMSRILVVKDRRGVRIKIDKGKGF